MWLCDTRAILAHGKLATQFSQSLEPRNDGAELRSLFGKAAELHALLEPNQRACGERNEAE
jgi:hypothetical protein